MKVLSVVVCFMCVNYLEASETYTAGVLQQNKEITEYTPFIYEASNTGVDVLVLPSPESSGSSDSYDETIKSISEAAKQARIYVVAHLFEKTRCHLGYEIVRSNLVFDREGSIVAVYRKPLNGLANCTSTASDVVAFTTDFGVTFGVLMEEDLVLRDVESMRELKNFVMTGSWHSEIPVLSAAQFASSWAYVTNANLASSAGIYSGRSGLKTGSNKLAVADLHKNGGNELSVPSVNLSSHDTAAEDLSQYIIRPLDLEASSKGYKETVCHGSFCCDFYVKTGVEGTNPEAHFALAAFEGVRHFGLHHNIGVQNCAVFACSSNLKTCGSGFENTNTYIIFEKISVAANFSKQNAQYPIVQSTVVLPTEKFLFDANTDRISKQVTLEIVDASNVINFGIFGRNFENDFENNFNFGEKNNTETTSDIYDFIFNEDVIEFFDYVWIRLRVLLFVVSIYILEMM